MTSSSEAAAATMVAPRVWPRPASMVALVIAAVAVPLRTGGEGAGLAHVTLADGISVLFVVFALAPLVTTRGYLEVADRVRSPMLLPVVAVLVGATVSALFSGNLMAGVSGYLRAAQLMLCVPLAVYVALRSRRDLWLVLTTFIVLAVAESALGVVQFVTGTGAGYGDASIRGIGTFGAYEIMAMGAVATTGLVISFAVALCRTGAARGWALAAASVCAAGVVASLSRGFWLAGVIAGFVTLFAAGRRRLAGVLAVGAVAMLTLVMTGVVTPSGTLGDRLSSATEALTEPDQSLQDRYALWGAATAMWSESPVWGVGLKGFEHYRDQYTGLGFSGLSDIDDSAGFRRVELLTPHNRYLLTLAEQGIVGLTAMLLLYGAALVAALRRLARNTDTGAVRTFGVAMVGAVTVDLISWMSDDGSGSLAVLSAVVLGGLLWFAAGLTPEER